MKLTYTKPASEAIALQTEGMMAASLKMDKDTTTDQALSNRHGWDADNWSGTAEKEE